MYPKSIILSSNGAIRLFVSGDPYAIGFISAGLADHSVKSVPLNGILPTRENIINGSYALFRPFLFVCNAPPTGETKAFIDFTLSAQGQQLLLKEGLIPID